MELARKLVHPWSLLRGLLLLALCAAGFGAAGIEATVLEATSLEDSSSQSAGDPPQVVVLSPNGAEQLQGGAVEAILWSASGGSASLRIDLDYSTNAGTDWIAIAGDLPNSGSFDWAVPDLSTSNALVRVGATDGTESATDQSDLSFTIVPLMSETVVLSFGSGQGPNGEVLTLDLRMKNDQPVKGLQFDLNYDPNVVQFVSGTGAGRGANFEADFGTSVVGRIRGVFHLTENNVIPFGQGLVATLDFRLVGAEASETTLSPSGLVVSDPDAESLDVIGTPGTVFVTVGPAEVPSLQISVLKNPGQTRAMTGLIRVENGSGSAPTVTLDGVALSLTDFGDATFGFSAFVPEGTASVTFVAADTNGEGEGTTQKVVTF